MKKYLLFIVLFLGILPIIKKGKLKLQNVTSASAQDWGGEGGDCCGVAVDANGNVYFPVDGGDLPIDGTEPQYLNTCVEDVLSKIADYYGYDLDPLQDVAYDYYTYLHDDLGENIAYATVVADGISLSDIQMVVDSYGFTTTDISGDVFGLLDAINNNEPVMGTLNVSDGMHEVMVVSCDIEGNTEYYDPATGHYGQGNSGDYIKMIAVGAPPPGS